MLIAISLIKTVIYLKIFKAFSYIVTMVISVVSDLRYFITFFVVLITFFSMLFNVVARNQSPEYAKLTWYIGNWLAVFRLSLGDFDFTLLESAKLTKTHILFWAIWLLMVLFTALIFLNFIIAEEGNSYASVRENVDSFIYKERAKLISESEELLSKKYKMKNKVMFPDYIIVR
jgi:glucan phosphoethanolaminetransferase (alkaline phosphatase superfamily)